MILTHPLRDKNAVITSKFGMRAHPVYGTIKQHTGVDYSAKVNTQVISPLDGVVTAAYWGENGGNQLVINHERYGISTGYAHLNNIQVAKGQRVKQGQNIALTGKTGNVTGPHLHFRIKDAAGNYINPENMIYVETGNPAANLLGWLAFGTVATTLIFRYVKEGRFNLS